MIHSGSISYWYLIKESWFSEIRVSGLMRFENERLLLEYHADTDNLNKSLLYLKRKLKGSFTPEPLETGAIQRVYIDPTEIETLELSSSFFSDIALLYMKSGTLSTFENIIGHKGGTLEFQIRKKDKKLAKQFILKLTEAGACRKK